MELTQEKEKQLQEKVLPYYYSGNKKRALQKLKEIYRGNYGREYKEIRNKLRLDPESFRRERHGYKQELGKKPIRESSQRTQVVSQISRQAKQVQKQNQQPKQTDNFKNSIFYDKKQENKNDFLTEQRQRLSFPLYSANYPQNRDFEIEVKKPEYHYTGEIRKTEYKDEPHKFFGFFPEPSFKALRKLEREEKIRAEKEEQKFIKNVAKGEAENIPLINKNWLKSAGHHAAAFGFGMVNRPITTISTAALLSLGGGAAASSGYYTEGQLFSGLIAGQTAISREKESQRGGTGAKPAGEFVFLSGTAAGFESFKKTNFYSDITNTVKPTKVIKDDFVIDRTTTENAIVDDIVFKIKTKTGKNIKDITGKGKIEYFKAGNNFFISKGEVKTQDLSVDIRGLHKKTDIGFKSLSYAKPNNLNYNYYVESETAGILDEPMQLFIEKGKITKTTTKNAIGFFDKVKTKNKIKVSPIEYALYLEKKGDIGLDLYSDLGESYRGAYMVFENKKPEIHINKDITIQALKKGMDSPEYELLNTVVSHEITHHQTPEFVFKSNLNEKLKYQYKPAEIIARIGEKRQAYTAEIQNFEIKKSFGFGKKEKIIDVFDYSTTANEAYLEDIFTNKNFFRKEIITETGNKAGLKQILLTKEKNKDLFSEAFLEIKQDFKESGFFKQKELNFKPFETGKTKGTPSQQAFLKEKIIVKSIPTQKQFIKNIIFEAQKQQAISETSLYLYTPNPHQAKTATQTTTTKNLFSPPKPMQTRVISKGLFSVESGQKLFTGESQKHKLKLEIRQDIKKNLKQNIKQDIKQDIRQDIVLKVNQDIKQSVKQTIKPIELTLTKTKQNIKQETKMPLNPIKTGFKGFYPSFPDIKLPFLFFQKGKAKSFSSNKKPLFAQPKGYKPSLRAVFFNIKGKRFKPAELTGIGTRYLLKNKKKKKRKNGKR